MQEEKEKITIIEGPPPTFQLVHDVWANGIAESPILSDVAVTQLRTFNGPALVERCHRAWRKRDDINLEFRNPEGETMEVPIVAAHTTEYPEGQVLSLWVRLPQEDVEFEFDVYDPKSGPDGFDDLDDLEDLDDFDDDPDDDDPDMTI